MSSGVPPYKMHLKYPHPKVNKLGNMICHDAPTFVDLRNPKLFVDARTTEVFRK
jgi:hypothetical protein